MRLDLEQAARLPCLCQDVEATVFRDADMRLVPESELIIFPEFDIVRSTAPELRPTAPKEVKVPPDIAHLQLAKL